MAIVVTEILDINPLLGLKPPNFSEPGTVSVFVWNRKMGKYEYNLVDLLERIRLNPSVIQGFRLDLSKGPTTKFIALSLAIQRRGHLWYCVTTLSVTDNLLIQILYF